MTGFLFLFDVLLLFVFLLLFSDLFALVLHELDQGVQVSSTAVVDHSGVLTLGEVLQGWEALYLYTIELVKRSIGLGNDNAIVVLEVLAKLVPS